MITEREVPQWKKDEVEYLVKLMKKYKNIIVIRVSNINDRQIQEMRKILRGDAVIRMSKKSLQQRALEKYEKETEKDNLDTLRNTIPGQSALMFTDLDPFELKRTFLDNKWMVAAKPGQEAPVDILVPKGDTGLPTGQVISEFNMILKLPTTLKNDTIHIREDTVTHEKGDVVSTKEASVLKKLGIEPIESIIYIHSAWTDGDLIPADVIYMDMETFREDIVSAYNTARTLAIEMNFIDSETIEPLVQKAYREALSLLFELPLLDTSLMEEYIKKAQINATMVNNSVFGGGSAPQGAQKSKGTQEKEKKEEKKEEESDDGEPAGIGSLF
jgi:large subunit ribosomal protein L10